MCLTKESQFPKLALKPITVYKAVNYNELKGYYPLFQNNDAGADENKEKVIYKINQITKATRFTGSTLSRDIFRTSQLHDGWIHASPDLSSLKIILRLWGINISSEVLHKRILECKIPRYTLYYNSNNGLDICARQIKVIRELSEEEYIYT